MKRGKRNITIESMIGNVRRMIQEVEEFILTVECIHALRPDIPPADFEGERMLLVELKKDLACLLRGDTVQSAIHARECVRIATENCRGIDV